MTTEPEPVLPAMWYRVDHADENPACVNYSKTFVAQCWSNAGGTPADAFDIVCGLCRASMVVLDYALLDPQPDVG